MRRLRVAAARREAAGGVGEGTRDETAVSETVMMAPVEGSWSSIAGPTRQNLLSALKNKGDGEVKEAKQEDEAPGWKWLTPAGQWQRGIAPARATRGPSAKGLADERQLLDADALKASILDR